MMDAEELIRRPLRHEDLKEECLTCLINLSTYFKFNPMPEVFSSIGFDDLQLKCNKCGWQGTGTDAVIIDLYGITKSQEVHCPNCDNHLGDLIVQEDRIG